MLDRNTKENMNGKRCEKMKKTPRIKNIICLLLLFMTILMSSTTVLGVWWGTPGYEWALSNKLTSVKSTTQLNQNVSLSDFYATVIKYLKLKGITPRNETIHHEDGMDGVDNVSKGIFNIINGFNNRKAITIQDFYKVENYVEHGKKTLNEYMDYSQYLTKNVVKNIDLYLELSKYKAATLIESRSDREYILSKLGRIKNAEIVDYHMLPYAGEITRREFLLVMFDLISSNELNDERIIQDFYDAGVLVGLDTGLELDKRITYSEMLTFLYRFEIFDFSYEANKNEANQVEE